MWLILPTEMFSLSYKNNCPVDDNESIYTDNFFTKEKEGKKNNKSMLVI